MKKLFTFPVLGLLLILNTTAKAETLNVTVLPDGVSYVEGNISFSPLSGIRNIWVYLPPDYDTETDKHYPVLYMQDGQNVFVEQPPSGSVDYPVGSWDVSTTLNELYDDGYSVGIVVAIDRVEEYKSEYSPWTNSYFSQSGTGNEYLQAVIENILPYVNSNYRTLTGPENTAIAGSDMGGLISYYGALKHQSIFGRAGIFSPNFWFNKDELSAYLESWTKNESSKMYFINGDSEGTTIDNDAQLFFEATKNKGYADENIKREIVEDGFHNNMSWGAQFRKVYAFLFDINDTVTPPEPTPGLQFMSPSGTSSVECTGTEPFETSFYYPTGMDESPTEVMTYIKTVPVEAQNTYYWNINKSGNCSGRNLFIQNKSVGFKSSRAYESWIRAVVKDDMTALDIAASSAFFRIKKADGTLVIMNRTKADGTEGEDDTYTVSAEVPFIDAVKNFELRFGSVNSGSIMPSLVGDDDAYPLSVSPGCTRAQIIYSFKTNKVIINCLEGETTPVNYQFMSHSAATGVECSGIEPFEISTYYPTGIDDIPTYVRAYVKTVPVEVKTQYFWNINNGDNCIGENLFESNRSVDFNSSKTDESWIRALVKEDTTALNLAASSSSFRVKKVDGTLLVMTRTNFDGTTGEDDTYSVSAEVPFADAVKNFEIRHGDVNTGAVQSSLVGADDAYPLSVSASCTNAQIIYSFKTNKVIINCLEGEPILGDYQFMSHSTSTGVECTGNEPFEPSTYYPTGNDANPSDVMTYIKTIPVEMKSQYFWNINDGGDCAGENLFVSNKSVGFSSKKAYESWIRAIVKEDISVSDAAASSAYFRVKRADGVMVVMSRTMADGTPGEDDSYTVSAKVPFTGAVKNFEIRFGSVNSGSIMSSLLGEDDTYPLSVSDDCVYAQIIYSFKTNQVSIIELDEPELLPTISHFRAVPSICEADVPVTVSALLNDAEAYDLSYAVSQNNGEYIDQPFTVNAQNEMVFDFISSTGIYYIQLKAKKGSDPEITFPEICVKVLEENILDSEFTGNPYAEVNWSTVGRYKGMFHCHTDWTSDATLTADEVVDLFQSKNYKILTLTNHNFNSFPWEVFSMFKPTWKDRYPQEMGMLTFPGNELSGDNHHNDFFTGRNDNGANLEASFTKTEEMGGMQLINHPGQYWNIGNTYTGLSKNSAAWHADNFIRHESLIGLEVYNAGDKHVNDRVLWDEILSITMPERPVWGYSNDDFHNLNMAFFNYQYMLMDELSIPALKEAMMDGRTVFSYEYGATGNALAPSITDITFNEENKTITISTPDTDVSWISGIAGSGPGRKSAVIAYGKTFFYDGFSGNYVRAFIKNPYGETCTQPFGFEVTVDTSIEEIINKNKETTILVYPNPASGILYIRSSDRISELMLFDLLGHLVKSYDANAQSTFEIDLHNINDGMYFLRMRSGDKIHNEKVIIKNN